MRNSENQLKVLREREFRALGDTVYLNAAAMGPVPERSRSAVERFNRKRGEVRSMTERDFVEPASDLRRAAAELIGASPEEIALGSNTSYGINLAAAGLQVPEGSVVLVSGREFPANVYPWMNRSRYRLELVPVDANGWPDEDQIIQRLTHGDVGIVALSSVQFHNGYYSDLERIGAACRAAGTYFVVDAIQSLGQIPLDVQRSRVDVLATGGHKWLCGPFGAGFAYIRREIQDHLDPVVIGWLGMRASMDIDSLLDYEFDFVPDARRYEVGTAPLQDHVGLTASIELLLEVGLDRVQHHIGALVQRLYDWLGEHPEVDLLSSPAREQRSGIVSFRPPEMQAILERLQRAGIICSTREGALRIAVHCYNTENDIGRLLDVLESSAVNGWR